MQDLKYYVLWTKNSELLSDYLEKYYNKLLNDLETIKESNIDNKLSDLIWRLFNIYDNKKFILNWDISSLINSIRISNDSTSVFKIKNEIKIFIEEWIDSENLIQNKWIKIFWTDIKLTINDNNPYNWDEAHPEHIVNWWVIWWWKKSEKEWLDIYEKTFILLKNVDEWIYYELNEIITKIVPLWTAEWLHNSASYKECIWHLYLWFIIDVSKPEVNNLEALIHESSHNKLNLIMQFDPLILNDNQEKYYSAIRPDARHIHWVLLWYHAFAPTMYIMMKSYINWDLWTDKWWLEKIVLYYLKVKFLQKVMKKYAKFTKLWLEINEEMNYVVSKMDTLFKKLNPNKEVINSAKSKQIEHFNQVNNNYPNLEY